MSSTQLTEGRPLGWVARRLESHAVDRRSVRWMWGAVSVLLVVALWTAASASGRWSSIILPSPLKVWRAFIQSVTIHHGVKGLGGAYLWQHLWASLWRILNGVFWAILFGVPLGIAIATIRPVQRITEPIVNFLRALPPLGYFTLLILWFGIGDTSKIWLLFVAAFPPISIATSAGVGSVRTERINASLVLGASRLQVITRTVLPSILPDIVTGVRIATGFAWTTIVAAETSNGLPGIGGLAWTTKKELRVDVAILCVIVIGITALVLDGALRLVERRFAPWKGRG